MKKLLCILLTFVLAFGAVLPVSAEEMYEEETQPVAVLTTEALYETPYADSQWMTYGDYTIHFRVLQAEKPVGQIMMIHGFALSGYCWTNLAQILVENGYTCVLVDLPDYGYSVRETASMEKLPRELLVHELMQLLSDKPWIVAGHSMGGQIALALMQTYPEDVSELLLYGTSGNDGLSAGMKTVCSCKPVAVVVGAFMQMAVKVDFILTYALRAGLADDEYAAVYDIDMIRNPLLLDGTGEGAIYCFCALTATDYQALRTCRTPIFYCNGTADTVISEDARVKLGAFLPSSAVQIAVQGGGHMFIENKAEEVAVLTLDFLNNN